MLICHLLVIPNNLSSHEGVAIVLNIPQFKCEIYFQIKSTPQSRVMADYYFWGLDTGDKITKEKNVETIYRNSDNKLN